MEHDFVIENGVLTKYNGPGGEVVVPEGVTKIGNGAFSGCTNLTRVTLPVSVAEVGYRAFYGCSDLTQMSLSLHQLPEAQVMF